MGWFEGHRPDRIGVTEKGLHPVDTLKRNSVSSLAEPPHHIAPLQAGPDPAVTFTRLAGIVAADPKAKIIVKNNAYVYAEYRSRWLGFVDDVEFLLDPAKAVIQVRSASRLGYSDLGVNRSRIEALRTALEQAAEPAVRR
jgi:uncharacterized protein (DUF1499 family)